MKLNAIFIFSVLMALAASSLARADVADGINALNSGDYATALREFRAAANNGSAEAQFRLGYMNQVGGGVPVDDVQAVTWTRKLQYWDMTARRLISVGSMPMALPCRRTLNL